MTQFKKMLSKYTKFLVLGLISIFSATCYANEDLISLFPLNNYDQTISTWINANDPNFDKPLLSQDMQKKRLNIFLAHYFGTASPWSVEYVNQIFHQTFPNDFKSIEQSLIVNFSNDGKPNDKIGYGENFRPYEKNWIEEIVNNINISQFDNLTYQASNRGIAIDNLHARALPTNDVYFYNNKLAGQGYPFDDLQISALWAGTPVYIVGETRDHSWLLVLTPDYIGWVESKGIARASNNFIDTWTKAAKHTLAAITQTKTSLVDDKGNFLLLTYVGSVFPANANSANMKLMVPAADADRNAVIKYAFISDKNASFMPVTATPHHFSMIMSTMLNRPYGWGNMYFYNDCSAELKSLFTPFGIWLPRHSSDQISEGKMVDMTSYSREKRLSYLLENGHRFMNIIYIGGHVVLYIGNYPDQSNHGALMAMTYQNIWGLSPNPPVKRTVIGKSVLFPMLLQYPEDANLISLADKKFFQISYLDELPDASYLLSIKPIDIKSLMYPNIMN